MKVRVYCPWRRSRQRWQNNSVTMYVRLAVVRPQRDVWRLLRETCLPRNWLRNSETVMRSKLFNQRNTRQWHNGIFMRRSFGVSKTGIFPKWSFGVSKTVGYLWSYRSVFQKLFWDQCGNKRRIAFVTPRLDDMIRNTTLAAASLVWIRKRSIRLTNGNIHCMFHGI